MADGDNLERQFPVSWRAPTTSFTPISTNPARGSDLAWQSLGDVLRHLSEGVSVIRHLMSSDFAYFSQAAPTAEAMNRVGRLLRVGRPAWSTRDQRASTRLGRRDDEHSAMTRADLLEDDIDLNTSGGKLLAHT